MLRILYLVYGNQVCTWGFVRWGRLAEDYRIMKRSVLIFFSSPMEDRYWMSLILQSLFGRGQGLVYDIFFSSLGIMEVKM